MKKRFILLVLDSVGVGALPDAAAYGDQGSNTLGNIARHIGGISLPNLETLGLGNIIDIQGVIRRKDHRAAFGKMAEKSAGKDTTTGHWELAGLIVEEPFPTYPNGFPESIIKAFEERIDRKVIGNKVASGTVIIQELGDLHVETGDPIVYTSADSVFQIAAHEEVVDVELLYQWCRIARKLLVSPHNVGRVIARPFIGTSGNYQRTNRRRDFSIEPFAKTILDFLIKNNIQVNTVGKIADIFANRGITNSLAAHNNLETLDGVLYYLKTVGEPSLIFANCVDFDMLWGHRNDVEGYAAGLMALDAQLPELIDALGSDDILCITADHGCDPTFPGTDHTREYVPLLVYGKNVRPIDLGIRSTYADVAATIAEFFGIEANLAGTSFFKEICRGEADASS
ncbi:MAG: phosphopentomutase [Firmicutes bacterium]|nr:phosphopentomutase [Bacillota bacterium]